MPVSKPTISLVPEHPAAAAAGANRHFVAKLSAETDPSDVHFDLERGADAFVLVDARSPEAYARCHIPGALSLPHRSITVDATFGCHFPHKPGCDRREAPCRSTAGTPFARIGCWALQSLGR